MLYESLEDIPRDCEVPYVRGFEDEVIYPQGNSVDSTYILPDTNVDNILDWD